MNIFLNVIYSCDFKAEFLPSLFQSHDPSEIILIFWFAVHLFLLLCWKQRSRFFKKNRKFKRTELIWNIYFCNIINVFIITFDQFKASLLNQIIHLYNPPPPKKKKNSMLISVYDVTKAFIWDKCWTLDLSIHQIILKKKYSTVLNFDNNNKCFLISKSPY